MNRVRLIEHGIVLQDFSAIPDEAGALALIQEARLFMETRPRDRSALILTDVTNSNFNQTVVDAMRALAEHHKPWVRASAVYGLTALMRVIVRALSALAGRDIKVFDSREAAIDYLVRVSGPASAERVSPQKPSDPPAGRR
jgi:hypothetical protein